MMAGSKSAVVEEQAETGEDREDPAALATIVVKRRTLELARIDVTRQLDLARAEAHRVMLRRALEALDQELDRLI
jgi:hypothetical protein